MIEERLHWLLRAYLEEALELEDSEYTIEDRGEPIYDPIAKRWVDARDRAMKLTLRWVRRERTL